MLKSNMPTQKTVINCDPVYPPSNSKKDNKLKIHNVKQSQQKHLNTPRMQLPRTKDTVNSDTTPVVVEDTKALLNQQLIDSCSTGEERELVQSLLEEGADVNARDKAGATPLMHACAAGIYATVKYLISQKADVHARDKVGATLLKYVCQLETDEIVEYLIISQGANVNAINNKGSTPLMYACLEGNFVIVNCLMNHGAHSIANKAGQTPLMFACDAFSCSLTTIKLLLPKSDVNAIDDNGNAALSYACRTGKANIVSWLIKEGATVSNKNKKGMTAFMYASRSLVKSFIMMKLLISKSDVNARNNHKDTALMYVCRKETADADAVKFLIDKEADVGATNKEGMTAFMFACASGNIEIVELLYKDFNVNIQQALDMMKQIKLKSKSKQDAIIKLLERENSFQKKDLENKERMVTFECESASIRRPEPANIDNHQVTALPEKDSEKAVNPQTAPITQPEPANSNKQAGTELVINRSSKKALANKEVHSDHKPVVEDAKTANEHKKDKAVNPQASSITQPKLANIDTQVTALPKKDSEKAINSQTAPITEPELANSNKQAGTELASNGSSTEALPENKVFHSDHKPVVEDAKTAIECRFIITCGVGSIEDVKSLLKQKVKINIENKQGMTPLNNACEAGRLDIVELLIGYYGVDIIDVGNKEGLVPFIVALQAKAYDVVKFLSEKGADVNATSKEGYTALTVACFEKRDVVKLLIKKGANLEAVIPSGETALMLACLMGITDSVKLLIEHGADVDAVNHKRLTSLMSACNSDFSNSMEIVELLLAAECNIDAKNDEGNSALIFACKRGKVDSVNLLIAKGIDVNARNYDGWTPLMVACQEGKTNIVNCLLDNGADFNARNHAGWTPLMYACLGGKINIVNCLLDKKVNINAKNNQELTSLMVACNSDSSNSTEIVELLLEARCDINDRNCHGDSALMIACGKEKVDVVKLLLKYEADVTLKALNGSTPLMSVCNLGNDVLFELLIHKSNVNAKTEEGMTAFMFACESASNNEKIIERLVTNKKCDIHARNNNKETAFMFICQTGKVDSVNLLIEKGAKWNAEDDDGLTSLMLACIAGKINVVKLLIEKGAVVNAKNSHGNTILVIACMFSENIEMIRYLLEEKASIYMTARQKNSPTVLDMVMNRSFSSVEYKNKLIELLEKYKLPQPPKLESASTLPNNKGKSGKRSRVS